MSFFWSTSEELSGLSDDNRTFTYTDGNLEEMLDDVVEGNPSTIEEVVILPIRTEPITSEAIDLLALILETNPVRKLTLGNIRIHAEEQDLDFPSISDESYMASDEGLRLLSAIRDSNFLREVVLMDSVSNLFLLSPMIEVLINAISNPRVRLVTFSSSASDEYFTHTEIFDIEQNISIMYDILQQATSDIEVRIRSSFPSFSVLADEFTFPGNVELVLM